MSVSRDIVATWTRPRQVMRRLLAQGRREDRALAILIAACLLIFVAQWPRIRREAMFAGPDAAPLEAQLAITFFAMMMIWPLLAYGVGGLSHLLARLFRGRGTWYSARLALFWTMLSTTPLWLFHGLILGFVGPGPAANAVGVALLLAFGTIWCICLVEAERAPEAETAA